MRQIRLKERLITITGILFFENNSFRKQYSDTANKPRNRTNKKTFFIIKEKAADSRFLAS
jgi:hypothetical protein